MMEQTADAAIKAENAVDAPAEVVQGFLAAAGPGEVANFLHCYPQIDHFSVLDYYEDHMAG